MEKLKIIFFLYFFQYFSFIFLCVFQKVTYPTEHLVGWKLGKKLGVVEDEIYFQIPNIEVKMVWGRGMWTTWLSTFFMEQSKTRGSESEEKRRWRSSLMMGGNWYVVLMCIALVSMISSGGLHLQIEKKTQIQLKCTS